MGGMQDTCSPPPLRKVSACLNGLSVTVMPPIVTERQKILLRTSWRAAEMDITKVGIFTFIGLFEANPEFQESFILFRGLTHKEMKYSVVLKDHALRVMGIVEKCINRLDDVEKIKNIMTSLGKKHAGYCVQKQYIDLMCPQFISSLQQMQGDWTDEHTDAWKALFGLITYHMKSTMPD
ncbi:neuroglobin-1-like [Gigantopelta aegis]|uniref:neuroglobin-1-like n=1 Tax=Gigantopelta aegis TaxID=1735272 RepID=UPI001B888AFD|nr:neuroglobin-1-like [Gigantopelta aegis]